MEEDKQECATAEMTLRKVENTTAKMTPRKIENACNADEGCTVCLELVPARSQERIELPCGHVFHQACIDALRKYGMNELCPVCRAPLLSGPDEEVYDRAVRLLVRADRTMDLSARRQLAEEALNLLQQAISSISGHDSFELHLNLGAAYLLSDDADHAHAAMRKAHALNPGRAASCVAYHSNFGSVCFKTGDLKGAIESQQRGIKLDPQQPQANCNLAMYLWKAACATGQKRDFKAAMVPARVAIAVSSFPPLLANAHMTLGSCLRSTGDPRGAVASFRRVVSIDPAHPMVHYNLGNALSSCGDLEGAITAYQYAIDAAPSSETQDVGQMYCNLGSVLHQKGDLKSAMVSLKRATSIYPNDEKAHLLLGNVLSDMAGYDTRISMMAVASYERAFAIDASSAFDVEAHTSFACALEAVDRDEAALVYWKSALANPCMQGWNSSDTGMLLARMRECEGRVISDAPGAGAAGAGAERSAGVLVLAALQKVVHGAGVDAAKGAAGAVLRYLENAQQHPTEQKYRRIKRANGFFATKVGSLPEHEQLMAAAGFELEADELYYVLLPRVSDIGADADAAAAAVVSGALRAIEVFISAGPDSLKRTR
jgi:tetratricopeptide (TPR) repeat protein